MTCPDRELPLDKKIDVQPASATVGQPDGSDIRIDPLDSSKAAVVNAGSDLVAGVDLGVLQRGNPSGVQQESGHPDNQRADERSKDPGHGSSPGDGATTSVTQTAPAGPQISVTKPDPLESVTACITEFRRPRSLTRLLESITRFYPSLKVDIQSTGSNLSWARNALAKRCRTPFYFMLEEDFCLDARTNLGAMLDVLHAEPECGGVSACTAEPKETGTVGRGGKIWWDRDLSRVGDRVFFDEGSQPFKVTDSGVRYRCCDLVLNFGLFRADCLRTISWDDSIPIGNEHADFFYRAWLDARWHFAHIPQVMCVHYRDRPGPEYNKPRRRLFTQKLVNKHGIAEFVRRPHTPAERRFLPNVIFLGVGCSGSTILTRMAIEAFGFHVGQLDAQYAEERRVRRLNQPLMDGTKQLDTLAAKRLLRTIPQPWIIKDPRFRRTLPQWVPVLEPFRPLLVYVSKDAAAVKASYERHGWSKAYDPADVDRCHAAFNAWPWAKWHFRAEDLSDVFSTFDPQRMQPAPA